MAGVQTQSVTPLSVLGLTDGVKMSELMQAAFFGDPKRCFERLGLGDDPNEASESCHGFTPLMLAVLSSEYSPTIPKRSVLNSTPHIWHFRDRK